MKSGFRKMTVMMMLAVCTFVLTASLSSSVFAQKSEHYNSPLYSPRKYEPGQEVAAGLPKQLKTVGIEQKLGESMPLGSVFTDENGKKVTLGDYFNKGRPVILALVYYECPMLCNQVLNGLTGTMKGVSLDAGKDYDVVAISFDANENGRSDLASNKKASYMERYGRPGTESGWHFLTGEQSQIDAVTDAVGFTYEWDESTKQFAHASGVMIINPDGRISKYFYGIDYAPRDIKLGLVESAENKVGSVTDQLLLYCFHYDPSTGKYGFAILNVLRGMAIVTLLGMGAMGIVFWRRNKIRRNDQ